MKQIYREIRFGEAESNPLRKLRARILLSSFSGRASDVMMAVHHLKDNEFFFANYAKEFFFKAHNLLLEGKLKAVKRILIYDGNDEILQTKTQKIIQFHAQNTGYDYRLVPESVFIDSLSKYDLPHTIDFGIYGNQRVYRARRDQRDYVIGTWSSRFKEVDKYQSIFKYCWESEQAYKQGDTPSPRVDINNLFEVDQA